MPYFIFYPCQTRKAYIGLRFLLFFIISLGYCSAQQTEAWAQSTATDAHFLTLERLYAKGKHEKCREKAIQISRKDKKAAAPWLFLSILSFDAYRDAQGARRSKYLNTAIQYLRKAQVLDKSNQITVHKADFNTAIATAITAEADAYYKQKKESNALAYYKHLDLLFGIKTDNYQAILLAERKAKEKPKAPPPAPKAIEKVSKVDSLTAIRNYLSEEAKKYVGVRYRYASCSPSAGFDCSGFTSFIYQKIGIELSRSSQSQIFHGEEVADFEDIKVGDLILFQNTQRNRGKGRVSHVAMVIACDEQGFAVIHATSSRGVVIDSSSSSVWESYWAPRILQIRRIIDG
ncbi:MAG: C40 family peptidase [Bernardetiaceae bacterium]|nr:C40 family peptidase [Bernardetiaceae bacterium]